MSANCKGCSTRTHFMTRPEWRNSYVSFRTTAEGGAARTVLWRPNIGRGLPRDVGLADAEVVFRGASRAERDGQDVALSFNSARDAQAAAAALSSFRGHALSYDFGNDRRDMVARGRPVARASPLRRRSPSRSPLHTVSEPLASTQTISESLADEAGEQGL